MATTVTVGPARGSSHTRLPSWLPRDGERTPGRRRFDGRKPPSAACSSSESSVSPSNAPSTSRYALRTCRLGAAGSVLRSGAGLGSELKACAAALPGALLGSGAATVGAGVGGVGRHGCANAIRSARSRAELVSMPWRAQSSFSSRLFGMGTGALVPGMLVFCVVMCWH